MNLISLTKKDLLNKDIYNNFQWGEEGLIK